MQTVILLLFAMLAITSSMTLLHPGGCGTVFFVLLLPKFSIFSRSLFFEGGGQNTRRMAINISLKIQGKLN